MPTIPVPKGYTSKEIVADALGTHDGVVPVQALDYWMAAAEQWIDNRAKRKWGVATVIAEQQTLQRHDYLVFLNQSPATAITELRARYLSLTATLWVVDPLDYEIVDPEHGHLLVASTWWHHRLSIDYTVSLPVPPGITLAATMLVKGWITPMLSATDSSILSGIKSYRIGQDLSVTYQEDMEKRLAPGVLEYVGSIVDQFRRRNPVV